MSDSDNDTPSPDRQDSDVVADDSSPGARPDRGWRDLWQAPTLIVGAVLLALGLLSAVGSKPRHDFPGALDDASALIRSERVEEALILLNDEIAPVLTAENGATSDDDARLHALRADAIFLGAGAGSLDPVNAGRVVDEYTEAERFAMVLTPDRLGRLAMALIALGREDEAIERVAALPDSASPTRRGILRRVIERSLDAPGGEHANERALDLLTRLAADPDLSSEERAWTIATQARLRLDAGYVAEAVDHLLLAIQRYPDLPPRHAARLYALLGRAYQRLGRLDNAEENIARAAERLSSADPQMADVYLVAGRIAQDRGDPQRARDAYAQVVADFTTSDAWPAAMLGLAETQGMLGRTAEAFDTYSALIDHVRERGATAGVDGAAVIASLLDQVGGALAKERYAVALRYAELARSVNDDERAAPGVLLALARSERLLADQTLSRARVAPDQPPDVALLDPVTRREIRTLYTDAGAHFLTHARTMILADDDAFADSLWNAGECFDLAGATDRAIEVFAEYANGRPDDPRRPAAMFRLAQAHQARGETEAAQGLYRDLIAQNPTSGEGTRSYLWLARTILADDDTTNDDEAESLLKRLVDGTVLEPESLEFREALKDLGRYYDHRGRLDEAIARLEEVVRRYPDDPGMALLTYELSDARRRRAEVAHDALAGAMPQADRARLVAQRQADLEAALRLFAEAQASLVAKPERDRTPLEESALRNAYFHRADTAFDLGRYDLAITLYDTAAQRYADDPVSLVAMAQIVSALIHEGRFVEARKANERARQRLADFSDEAFARSDLPFSRRHWERWLDSTDALSRGDSEATTAAASNESD